MTGDSAHTRIVIEIERDTDPIEGRLLEPESEAQAFKGWLSLTALLDAARQAKAKPRPAQTKTKP